MTTVRLMVMLMGGCLCGCSLSPTPPTDFASLDLDAPDSWAAEVADAAAVDEDWVRAVGGQPLVALVTEALARNFSLMAMGARVDQARANAKVADSAAGPKFGLNADAQRQRQNFIGFPIPGQPGQEGPQSTRSNRFSLTGDLQWELDLWGRIRAARRAGLADYQASDAEFRAAQLSLAADVSRAWVDLLAAKQQRQIASESLQAFRQTEEILTQRFVVGDDRATSPAQIRLARTDVATAEADVAQRGSQLDEARRNLELLLGRYPQGEIEAVGGLPRLTSPPPAGLPSELLLRRPDLLASERRYAAAQERDKEADRALFPTLRLTSSLGTSTEDLEEILNSDFGIWSLAAGAVQPLFRSGEIVGEMRLREAAEREALAQLQADVLAAFGEVESALAAESWLRKQEQALVEAVEQARQADEQARANFADGNEDVLTLLTAQRRWLQLRVQLVELRKLRLQQRVGLHLALGGGFLLGED